MDGISSLRLECFVQPLHEFVQALHKRSPERGGAAKTE